MPLYVYQAAYTPGSVAAQIREPHDRFEAVRPAFEAMGGKIVVGGYPFGEYDMLAVIEAPDDTTAAGFALAVIAGGAVRSASTTRLLNGQNGLNPCGRRKALLTKPHASHTAGHGEVQLTGQLQSDSISHGRTAWMVIHHRLAPGPHSSAR